MVIPTINPKILVYCLATHSGVQNRLAIDIVFVVAGIFPYYTGNCPHYAGIVLYVIHPLAIMPKMMPA